MRKAAKIGIAICLIVLTLLVVMLVNQNVQLTKENVELECHLQEKYLNEDSTLTRWVNDTAFRIQVKECMRKLNSKKVATE